MQRYFWAVYDYVGKADLRKFIHVSTWATGRGVHLVTFEFFQTPSIACKKLFNMKGSGQERPKWRFGHFFSCLLESVGIFACGLICSQTTSLQGFFFQIGLFCQMP